jgi:pyruvate dehydrogenase E2 component (dihydrolipoamide acetyltransferase)
MPVNILMPALSPTMTEGTLARWLVKEGDPVTNGDTVAEIETDKATMEVEAIEEGRVGKILVSEGTENVPVNEPIAILLEEGEDESALKDAAPAAGQADGQGGRQPAETGTDQPASKEPVPQSAAPSTAGAPGTPESLEQAPPAPPAPKDAHGNRVFASPLARRMARQAGIDLTQVTGSGPHGRIVRHDVEKAIERGVGAPATAEPAPADGTAPAEQPSAKQPAQAPPAQPAAAGPDAKAQADMLGMAYTEKKLSSMRKTIAKRMIEAKQAVPHFYLTVDFDMDALLRTRKELNARAEQKADGVKISVNDFLIRACALALMEVPAANTAYNGSTMLQYEHADISVAVATEGGLITPVIKQAETKGLATISREMKDKGKRAQEGKLAPEEYQGGTFSLSNLGMFGIKEFEAIINPPQACILAVGKSEQRPVVKDNALATATMMTASLSVDHRVVDGAIGARYLDALKGFVEDPLTMML